MEAAIFFQKKQRQHQILVVCTANITRSPYVAAYLRKALGESGIRFHKRFVVESAGLNAAASSGALPTISTIAYTKGMPLHDHRSRLLTPELARGAMLILTMEKEHKNAILKRFPELNGRVYQLTEFGRESGDKEIRDVPDPTGKELEDFQAFVELAEKEVPRVVRYLIQRGYLD